MQNLIDIHPQTVELEYGAEPSLREIVKYYYVSHNFSEIEANEAVQKYFKTLFEQVTPFRY